jgi:hypothetical protein
VEFPFLDDHDELDDDPIDIAGRLTNDAPHSAGPMHQPIEHEILEPDDPRHMVCQRGPCAHLFEVVARYRRTASLHTVQFARSCVAGPREIDLADQNFYRCSKWKPRQLAWLPEPIWATLRPLVAAAYEKYLLGTEKPAWLLKLEQVAADKKAASERQAAAVPAGMKLPKED